MSWEAPTVDAPSAPSLPTLPTVQSQATVASSPALGNVTAVAPSVANDIASGHHVAPSATTTADTPKWKKRKKSSARRLVYALVATAVVTAVGIGAWAGLRAANSSDDSTPPVPYRERSDTIFGKAGSLIDEINDQMLDQELVDQLSGTNSD